jgi:hypothetical protein
LLFFFPQAVVAAMVAAEDTAAVADTVAEVATECLLSAKVSATSTGRTRL